MRTLDQPLRTVAGFVNYNGTINTTETPADFYVQKGGAGSYTVIFTPRFAAIPAVSLNGYGSHFWIVVTQVGLYYFVVAASGSQGGAGVDNPFYFTATGIRLKP